LVLLLLTVVSSHSAMSDNESNRNGDDDIMDVRRQYGQTKIVV
jgi:hypothetical protein